MFFNQLFLFVNVPLVIYICY